MIRCWLVHTVTVGLHSDLSYFYHFYLPTKKKTKMMKRDPRAPEMMAAVGSEVPLAPSKILDRGGVQVGTSPLVELEVWLPSMGQPEGQSPADALGAGLRPVGRASL